MIDTVALTINKPDYFIDEKVRCTNSGKKGFSKRAYNPTEEQCKKFGYLPRCTEIDAVREGGYKVFLRIEFSIPKLLYGNNFDEVSESEFGEVCWKLKTGLEFMEIIIKEVKSIEHAEVSAIHYSKNIILSDFTFPSNYIKEIGKANIGRIFDLNDTDYRNEGQSIKIHTNSFELIFYDKLKDLEQAKKSEKRAVEKDNQLQLHLFDSLKMKKPFEVLRLEIRLGNRKKIKSYTKVEDLTFINLFRADTSKRILLETLEKIERNYPLIPNEQTNEEFYSELITKNPKLNFQKSLAFLGATVLINDIGIRKFREVSAKFGCKSWYRLNQEIKKIKITRANPFKYIHEEIDKFETVILENYKDKM